MSDASSMDIRYDWRGQLTSKELEGLHAEAFGHEPADVDWTARLHRHSLGWVCARRDLRLVGFVNVAWDGASHAFLLDAIVCAAERYRGVGTELVAVARSEAAKAGCQWLHVDFEDHLGAFYLESCGFRPTSAGLIRL
jgi:GNAT superfamily N-acetyltransferase